MQLSSILFTFYFFPLCLLLFYLVKERGKTVVLLVFSILFYIVGAWKYFCILLLEIVFCWFIAKKIEKSLQKGRKPLLLISAASILIIAILFIFKLNSGLAFPLGISFFSFRMLSYLFDIYRRKYPTKKLSELSLYVSFFPQMISGPIVSCDQFSEKIKNGKISSELFVDGFRRFILGFCKKILLADRLAIVADEIFSVSDYSTSDPRLLWLGSICYSLQLFYDFSGYSDMSLGVCKMFGLSFDENFNYPYTAKSSEDFWRRWHISLSTWFRDYVYIPLGGSRVSVAKHIRNLFIVWILTGLWHGCTLNFIIWGMMYFILLVLEKYFIHPAKRTSFFQVFWRIVTLFCINFGWILFRCPSDRSVLCYFTSMMSFNTISVNGTESLIRYAREFGIYFIPSVLFCMPIIPLVKKQINKSKTLAIPAALITPVLYVFLFILALSFLLTEAHHPFIYANF